MTVALEGLFAKYDKLVLFDTETTGLRFNRDEVIEFAAVTVELRDGQPVITEEYDELITLSPGNFVPENIQQLTGITNEDIRQRGIPKEQVCRDIARLLEGKALKTGEMFDARRLRCLRRLSGGLHKNSFWQI